MKKLFLILLVFAARAAPAFSAEADTVKLAIGFIPHIQFAPLYVGMEKGFYEEAGIDLDIEYGFGIDIFSLLATERIDIGLSDSDQLILAGSKGLPLKAVFQYYQSYPVTIVAQDGEVRTPQDFAGKTIGTPELYGTSYIGLQVFLKKFGLEGKTKVERIGYSQIPSLLADRVDGAVCFLNNEPIQLREMGVEINSWEVGEFSDLVGASFISSNGILRKRGDVLRRFADATARAIAYTITNPDEAVNISTSYIGNVEEEQLPFMKKSLLATAQLFRTDSGYGAMNPVRYRESIRILEELGLITRSFPAERILHSFK